MDSGQLVAIVGAGLATIALIGKFGHVVWKAASMITRMDEQINNHILHSLDDINETMAGFSDRLREVEEALRDLS